MKVWDKNNILRLSKDILNITVYLAEKKKSMTKGNQIGSNAKINSSETKIFEHPRLTFE